MSVAPILIVGVGRMGGAMLEGWRGAAAFAPADLLLVDPHPSEAAKAAAEAGAALNPDPAAYAGVRTVLLAVKPQLWKEAAAKIAPHLSPEVVVVSIAAGVRATDIAAAFSHPVARVMPTTAVGIGKGVATLFSENAEALGAARALFEPVATVVEVEHEALIDAATAVSGSAPAYLYAFVEALEAAGETVGLTPLQSQTLARATLIGAAALMERSGEEPAELRRQVTSPGGTTEAALKVLMGEGGFDPLLKAAAAAALARARALAG